MISSKAVLNKYALISQVHLTTHEYGTKSEGHCSSHSRSKAITVMKVFINFRILGCCKASSKPVAVSVYWLKQWDAKVSQQLNTRFCHEKYQYCDMGETDKHIMAITITAERVS